MRWATVLTEHGPRACGFRNGEYVDVNAADPESPSSVRELLAMGEGIQLRAWEKLPTGITEAITGLRLFGGSIYAATAKGVYQHNGDKLVALTLPKKDAPKTFGHLDATREALWSIGGKDIFTYDGKVWTRIE